VRSLTVTYRGTVVPLAEMGTWTYEEAPVAERVTGITVGQMALSHLRGPNSLTALGFAVVSLLRAGVEFDEATIGTETLDDLIVDFIGKPAADEPQEGDESPPEHAAGDVAERDETAAKEAPAAS
jgi:hypothetical protein